MSWFCCVQKHRCERKRKTRVTRVPKADKKTTCDDNSTSHDTEPHGADVINQPHFDPTTSNHVSTAACDLSNQTAFDPGNEAAEQPMPVHLVKNQEYFVSSSSGSSGLQQQTQEVMMLEDYRVTDVPQPCMTVTVPPSDNNMAALDDDVSVNVHAHGVNVSEDFAAQTPAGSSCFTELRPVAHFAPPPDSARVPMPQQLAINIAPAQAPLQTPAAAAPDVTSQFDANRTQAVRLHLPTVSAGSSAGLSAQLQVPISTSVLSLSREPSRLKNTAGVLPPPPAPRSKTDTNASTESG